VLASATAKRTGILPDVPTMGEVGMSDFDTSIWFGLMAPAGTPRPIVDKLNAEMKRITALPGMGDRLAAIELTHSTPEELGAFIKAETERWAPVIKRLGLKAD
jgi:tripartite-type tricarboxylate transporter receptor subunit TctC